jgi:hypothetical protein
MPRRTLGAIRSDRELAAAAERRAAVAALGTPATDAAGATAAASTASKAAFSGDGAAIAAAVSAAAGATPAAAAATKAAVSKERAAIAAAVSAPEASAAGPEAPAVPTAPAKGISDADETRVRNAAKLLFAAASAAPDPNSDNVLAVVNTSMKDAANHLVSVVADVQGCSAKEAARDLLKTVDEELAVIETAIEKHSEGASAASAPAASACFRASCERMPHASSQS